MEKLTLCTSNQMERLAGKLADNMRRPLRSALTPEIVLVQSQGMARWLKLQLAQQHGICSNCQFPFPRAFTLEICKKVLGDLPEATGYDPELLTWRLMSLLPGCLGERGFEALKYYLAGNEPDTRKHFQLAERIARVFDQYLVFRPEMIRAWESGTDESWQSVLWRQVSAPFREQHPAALQARLLERLSQSDFQPEVLPERITLFGISALPPFYLKILAGMSRHIEVNLYVLEPCEQFWGYISSVREEEQILRRAGRGAAEAEQLHLERGNRLLASMGHLGRDFLRLIQEAGDLHEAEPSLFEDPGEESLLSCIQSDILNLQDRGTGEIARKVVRQEGDSLQVHSCHSPLRELEVLHDHLLDWFERDPNLAPRDILVMIPEIEAYAPFIQAVFGSPEQENLRIPFSLADRTAKTQSHLTATFLSMLQLTGSRLGANQVIGLLESEPVRRKFGLGEEALELIRRWVAEVRIRWGEDQEQRAALGLPAWPENTWRHGLRQLLLGYAMAGNKERLFADILPYDDIEGDASEVLGGLAEFLDQLFNTLKTLKDTRPPKDWVGTFHSMLETFFETTEDQVRELQVLNSCFEKLTRAQEQAGFDQAVDLSIILEQLTRDLSEDPFGAGYLTGGVTFCALKPMRSIPAKVICLLGMNDQSFPRTSPQLSFDLMSHKRRAGDRSSREDDRYLFLETLVSARQRLYLSYVGQSVQNNNQAPPSVVVSELLDYVGQGFEFSRGKIIEDHVLTQHRLQAFSTEYFDGGRLFSYSRENLTASQAISPQRTPPGPLMPKPLGEPEPEWRRLTMEGLSEFLCNPAKFLAVKRLGLRLPYEVAALEEREAFEIAGLERYQLQVELLELKLAGRSLSDSSALVRASGRLPGGIAGNAQFAKLRREVEVFYKKLQAFNPGDLRPRVPFELAINGFVINGNFDRITPTGMLFYRPATIKPKDFLQAWVQHLLWSIVRPKGEPMQTVLVGSTSICRFDSVPEPKEVLKVLLERYWLGLCQPLKFFPATSYAFATADLDAANDTEGKAKTTPIEMAQKKWEGGYYEDGECQDHYFSLFFKNGSPLDQEFEDHARAIFRPLLSVCKEDEQ